MRKSSSCCRNCSCMEKVDISSSCGNDRNQKLKDRMCIGGGSSVGRVSDDSELLSTWPPRHYTCSICKRRFKSAQALGGHMNVHRRARALLRSQSVSPISSPSSSTSPWHPTNISTAHSPQQNNETYVIDLTNPDFKCSSLNTPHLTRNPCFPCLPSHLPMIGITSPSTLRHVNPLSAAASGYKHSRMGSGQNHHTHHKPFNGVISAMKNNCIMVEYKFNNGLLSSKNTHQDDALVRLSLGNGLIISNSTDQKDIDLELHL